jgi:hypothetical protein
VEDPDVYPRLSRAIVLVKLGRIDEARDAVGGALAGNPDFTQAMWRDGAFYSDRPCSKAKSQPWRRRGCPSHDGSYQMLTALGAPAAAPARDLSLRMLLPLHCHIAREAAWRVGAFGACLVGNRSDHKARRGSVLRDPNGRSRMLAAPTGVEPVFPD